MDIQAHWKRLQRRTPEVGEEAIGVAKSGSVQEIVEAVGVGGVQKLGRALAEVLQRVLGEFV